MQWLHAVEPKAQGLIWTARLGDTAQAEVPFGDRIHRREFGVLVDRRLPIPDFPDEVICVAEYIGID